MGRVNRRAKACDIPAKVKAAVWLRDGGRCVLCGRGDSCLPSAHYISRARGGLGVEENVVTLCTGFAGGCHDRYDHGDSEEREAIRQVLREYLRERYAGWEESSLIYRK